MSEGKIICIVKCENCGKDVEIRHKKRLENEHICCSRKCAFELRKNKSKKYPCKICGKLVHRKPNELQKNKNIFCSTDCMNKWKSAAYLGENNHQYGLKGSANASWRSGEHISSYGYKLIRVLDHPFRNSDDMVFEHRLVAEKYLLTDECTVVIDGKKYLSHDYIVHHKDHNRLNNNVENLQIMTRSEHTKMHMAERI